MIYGMGFLIYVKHLWRKKSVFLPANNLARNSRSSTRYPYLLTHSLSVRGRTKESKTVCGAGEDPAYSP